VRLGRLGAVCSAAVFAALVVAACGGGSKNAEDAAAVQGSDDVTELRSLEPLKAAFAADRGRARVVLLVSPT
jgi:hypothetical protein